VPGEIHLINTWKNPTFLNSNNDKVPSEIIYRDHGPVEWGFYPKANQPPLPIRWFKVLLDEEHMQEGLERDEILKGTKQYLESVGKSAEDVVADYLRLVWEYSFQEIQNKYLTDINQSFTFRIVITVPAIWNPEAREKTKRAISLAGLPKNSVVQAVEEPTAAAIATLNHLMRSEPNSIQQGDCYLVCDAGGGTVDLISYEVRSTQPLQIEPIAKADGCVCGSILLDRKFHNHMKKRIGPEIFDKLSNRKKEKMMTSFEHYVKRRFKYHLRGDEHYSVELSGVPKGKGIDTEEGLVYLSPDTLRAIFDPVCLNIFDLIQGQKLLAENQGKKIGTILLVGGFGMSIYLKEFLKAKCEPQVRVFQPLYGLTAVCRGATMWGLEKSKAAAGEGQIYTVPSSIARCNYGVIDTEPMLWDANNPDHQNLAKRHDPIIGEWVVKNRMKWLLRYGDRVYFDRIETVRLSNHFSVERDWKSFFFPKDITFTTVLYYSKLEKAPFQYSQKTVSALCTVEVKIPGSKVSREKVFVKKDHKKWYKVEYDLRLELGHNNLIFRLQYGDHEYGKVTQDLEEPFRGPSGSSDLS
jgi:actin-like ATPase involved in cell morphogenesis